MRLGASMPFLHLASIYSLVFSHFWAGLVWCVVQLWRWPCVTFIAAGLFGVGANAIFGEQYIAATLLFLLGIGFLVAKVIGEARSQQRGTGVAIVILLMGGALFYGSLRWMHSIESKKDRERAAAVFNKPAQDQLKIESPTEVQQSLKSEMPQNNNSAEASKKRNRNFKAERLRRLRREALKALDYRNPK